MSLAKTDGMTYEATPIKKVNGKRAALKVADQLNSASLVWLLVKRHKVALLAIGNIILILNWSFPEWPTFVRSLFS